MKKIFVIFLLIMVLFKLSTAQNGLFVNDFEQKDSFGPWTKVIARYDTSAYNGNFVCRVEASHEYGFGVSIRTTDNLKRQNLNISFEAAYRFNDSDPDASVVMSVDNSSINCYWNKYPISGGKKGEWFKSGFNTMIPADYMPEGTVIKIYVLNHQGQEIDIDDARVEIETAPMPRFLPKHQNTLPLGNGKAVVQNSNYGVSYFPRNKALTITNANSIPLTKGIYTVTEAIIASDTMTFIGDKWVKGSDGTWICRTPVGLTKVKFVEASPNQLSIAAENAYNFDMLIARQALVVPFNADEMEVYRTNCLTDTIFFQDCYYLADKGFTIGKGENSISTCHNSSVGSIQFDAVNRTAYFNADYWRDHPLIHYPLDDDTLNYFVDISCRQVGAESVIKSNFDLFIGIDSKCLPVFMPTFGGYDAAIIFTEHADWTDIRTQRAVLFGNENIKSADSAVGGFVYYNVPVTKSVFYNNPEGITNEGRSEGVFVSEQATLMGKDEFLKTIEQLHELGFDICLHTPEQNTTCGNNMDEALDFMQRHFNSVCWIDHGYNNTSQHNRENLLCDALLPDGGCYSLPLWNKYGIRYLWNAYYEENPMPQYDFDCNFKQPYPGYGDALPRPQVTTLPNGDTTLLLWSTSSTFETNSDSGWDYFFSRERLERLSLNHDVHITHVYPAWVLQERSCWEYVADSVITARKGFNRALARISELRTECRLNAITIAEHLRYVEAVGKIKYGLVDRNHVTLFNSGNDVKGVSLLFAETPDFGGKEIETRNTIDGSVVVWFDMYKNETITIKYRK